MQSHIVRSRDTGCLPFTRMMTFGAEMGIQNGISSQAPRRVAEGDRRP